MSKKLVTVFDASDARTHVEKRVVNTIKSGRCNSRTIRTDKLVFHSFDVQIEARDGITHTLERKRLRKALISRFPNRNVDDLRRQSDGSYIFGEVRVSTIVDTRIRDELISDPTPIVDVPIIYRIKDEIPITRRQDVSTEGTTIIYEFVADDTEKPTKVFRFISEHDAATIAATKRYRKKPVTIRAIAISNRLVSSLKNQGLLA